jgi:hypothetical protein
MERIRSKLSPGVVVATIALILALTGVAVAGPQALVSSITKSKVKTIAKKQANRQINRRAPGLKVASAQSANPAAFAQVAADGTVAAANSKGLTQANLINSGPIVGYYCFGNLPFAPRGGNVTLDWNSGDIDSVALIGLGGNIECPAGTQLFVDVRKTDQTGSVQAGFFLTLYR